MPKRRLAVLVVPLLTLATCLFAGCTTGFIAEQGRDSLASFITGVLTTAVNETVNP